MKHTLLITTCLFGLTGFTGIVPSQAFAQTLGTSSIDAAPSQDFVTRNDHAISNVDAPDFAPEDSLSAPVATLRPKARGVMTREELLAHHTKSATDARHGRTLRNARPRSVFTPAAVPARKKPRTTTAHINRGDADVDVNHGVFR